MGTFFYTLILIICIVIIFDISEKIDDFLERQAPLKAIIFDYYFNFIPYFVNLFMALFTFISVIFFTSKLAGDSEIIAMLSNGVSFKRLLWPYFLSATVIAIMSMVLINWVIPPANAKRLVFEELYYRSTFRHEKKNFHRQISPGTFMYFDNYNYSYNIGYKFTIEKFENGELKSKLMSDYVQWDTTKMKWVINNYFIRDYNNGVETITKGRQIDTTLNILPDDFLIRDNYVESMNYSELNEFIDNEIMVGSDNVVLWKLEKYQRFSYPFATYILTLIGVCLSSRKTRGGIGLNIGIGILLAFSYIMFMQVSTVLATNANMDPMLAVWTPNILFALIGAFLFYRASR